MLTNLFAPLGTRIFGGISLALLLGCVGLGLWARAEGNRADKWEARAEVEASNHRQTKDNYRAAQVEAKALWQAHREADEKRSAEMAKEIDDAKGTLDRLRADSARFRASHSMQALCGTSAESASRGATTGGEDHPTPSGDGSGSTEFVVLTRQEFDQLAEHDNYVTDRLNRVRAWGGMLIEDNRAIPLAEFGQADAR
ncbi:hypothetical protein [Novosphingobium sp. KN65.2]|uniref:hypothetical protein n=1 Tax=Novosphingobium sp. KN65.2 TaxID=1478134 RepID=UPI0005E411B6|nr:hypothetical protein [Novosphingobium sp. KN65.2]CDO34031.1 exported hypothetical protein [Novosphingobium sp. KN65.2]